MALWSKKDTTVKNPADEESLFIVRSGAVALFIMIIITIIATVMNTIKVDGTAMWDTEDITVPANLSVSHNSDGNGDYVSFYTNENAEKRVDIFVDPRCPACSDLEADIAEKMTSAISRGDVKLNIHYLTFLDGMTNSDYSKQAVAMEIEIAKAGNAAAAWKFHQAMWENQPGEGVTASALPTSEDWAILAEDLGVGRTFITRIREEKLSFIDQATQADAANTNLLKEKAGKVSTPTVYVDLNVLENPFYLIDEL